MLMKEETETAAGEAYDGRKYADGAGTNEGFIVVKSDTKVDRCYFLYLLGYALCKSHILS